ncbi:MAG: DUF488 domain-containing protein [Deltaproteobacteria bacterium]|nr:MAG: DUF488 domain-containing protein [Deltaproteobacteria bacterium]
MAIFTIGHSTRRIDEFLKILKHYEIELLVDVRTVPRSRHVPQFNLDALKQALHSEGIEYAHQKKLGGLRKPAKSSLNLGWRNVSFRGFADYMQSDEFWDALRALIAAAQKKRLALMCAEAVPWRCHRSLIADALTLRKLEVRHILSETSLQSHDLTSFAVIESERLTYPKTKADRSLFE